MDKTAYYKLSSADQLAWRQANGHRAYMELMRGKVAPAPKANPEAVQASVRRMASELMNKVR